LTVFRRIWLGVLGTLVVAVLVALAASFRPPFAAVAPPDKGSFPPEEVARGAELARIGDCRVCHTADAGAPFAGGRGLPTPFGTIYATNITPDIKTGIGAWSEPAFRRAMKEGVARNGAHLYPAFPYDHFRNVSDADVSALYAFLFTRRPVEARAPRNRLIPPLGFRPLLAGWKLISLRAPSEPERVSNDPVSRRGAYLVAGLGHCGACHTPHNLLGAEETDRPLAGGTSEGWYAPPLNADSPAARTWTADRIYALLRTGLDTNHAASAGPMGRVSQELSGAPDADVRAISIYVASQMRAAPATQRGEVYAVDRAQLAARNHPSGATLFAGACAECHEPGAPMMLEGRPPLQLGSPLHEETPRNTILMIRQGLQPPVGRYGPYMPAFGNTFTDTQTTELVAYLRARFSDRAPWPNLGKAVAQARKEGS
jgi:mono/diheme cytochrome c family protein